MGNGIPYLGSVDLAGVTITGSTTPTKVTGITEARGGSVKTTDHTEPAGALTIGFLPDASFVGTVLGVAWAYADGAYSDSAMPGNVLPAYPITISAGSIRLFVGRAA